MFNTEIRNFRINVLGFSMVGFLFYLYSFFQDPSTIKANPLYSGGANGLYISIVGASITYFYFRHSLLPIYRIIFLSITLLIIWVAGVMYIGSNLTGDENLYATVAWVGLPTIMFFMFLGAVNGIFGIWIALFNFFILGNALMHGQGTEPLMWTSILPLAGIDNLIFQWAVVLISAILGVSDKGYSYFVSLQS